MLHESATCFLCKIELLICFVAITEREHLPEHFFNRVRQTNKKSLIKTFSQRFPDERKRNKS